MMQISGTVQNFVKTLKLMKKWELKQQGIDPNDPKAEEISIEELQQKAQKKAVKKILEKMRAGKKLSMAEMEILREADPILFQKAKMIQEEQEDYERALRRCQSKEEVRQLHNKMGTMLCSSVGGEGGEQGENDLDFAQMRAAAFRETYKEFTSSIAYQGLKSGLEQKEKDPAEKMEEKRQEERARL